VPSSLLGWVALAAALGAYKGEIVAYEAVKPRATGIGVMSFAVAERPAVPA
jgi:hypothetical protein